MPSFSRMASSFLRSKARIEGTQPCSARTISSVQRSMPRASTCSTTTGPNWSQMTPGSRSASP